MSRTKEPTHPPRPKERMSVADGFAIDRAGYRIYLEAARSRLVNAHIDLFWARSWSGASDKDLEDIEDIQIALKCAQRYIETLQEQSEENHGY